MTHKRNLLNELMDGIGSMKNQRTGKVTLRSHTIEELPPLQINADLIRETREIIM